MLNILFFEVYLIPIITFYFVSVGLFGLYFMKILKPHLFQIRITFSVFYISFFIEIKYVFIYTDTQIHTCVYRYVSICRIGH